VPAARECAVILLVSLAAAYAGCSHRKTIDRDQAQSAIRSAISFAAESEMFIGYLRRGQATDAFARSHLQYLENEIRRSETNLGGVTSDADTSQAVRDCRAQLRQLENTLSEVRAALHDKDTLSRAAKSVSIIRLSLKKTARPL
jgi:hypothetical protein